MTTLAMLGTPLTSQRTSPERVVNQAAGLAPTALLAPEASGLKSLIGLGRYAAAPALLSEAVGSTPLVQGTPAEPWARAAALLAAPGIAGKLITPNAVNAERQGMMQTLREHGVKVAPGGLKGAAEGAIPRNSSNGLRKVPTMRKYLPVNNPALGHPQLPDIEDTGVGPGVRGAANTATDKEFRSVVGAYNMPLSPRFG